MCGMQIQSVPFFIDISQSNLIKQYNKPFTTNQISVKLNDTRNKKVAKPNPSNVNISTHVQLSRVDILLVAIIVLQRRRI